MATQAYYNWVAAGRPYQLARPVIEYRAAFRVAGWPLLSIGTIGNEAHLQADTPKDHCPFSFTGWPGTHPYPFVLAIDVSHNVSRETELDNLVRYWVSEARAERTPWVKYIIYKGQSWDVRSSWDARVASGHWDHAHISMRTDYVGTSIGAWNPLGTSGNGGVMWDAVLSLPYQEFPELGGQQSERAGPLLAWTTARVRRQEVEMVQALAGIAEIKARLDTLATIDALALAQALVAQPDFVGNLATAVADRIGKAPAAQDIAQATVALLGREITD